MINKRGRLIAVLGGGFILLFVLLQNTGNDGLSKKSFYDNFTTSDDQIKIEKSKKKTASIQTSEDEILENSESYQHRIKNNQKDKAFSLYREILEGQPAKVEETITEKKPEKEQQSDPIEKPKVVYVEKVIVKEQPEPEPEKEDQGRRFTRLSSSRTGNKAGDDSNKGQHYIKAEIYQATTVDLAYPNEVIIRTLEPETVTLPSGKVLKPNTMLRGIPKDNNNKVLDIYVPEYNLHVYNEVSLKGIPLTLSEGISAEGEKLKQTEVSTDLSIPIIGSVELSSGKKRVSRKIKLNASRSIYLLWEK